MMLADVVRAVGQATIALLLVIGHANVVTLIVVSIISGAAAAFSGPGRAGFVPLLVAPQQLQQANSLLSVATSIGSIGGPAIGGGLAGLAGASVAIALSAFTYAISAVCLFVVRAGREGPVASEGATRALLEGWHAFRTRPWLWILVLQFAVFHLLVLGPLTVLGPLRYRNVPDGAAAWGTILSIGGLGAVIGGLISLRLRPRYPLRAALVISALYFLAPAALAISAPVALRAIAFATAQASVEILAVLWSTTMQRQIPATLLSRVSAYDSAVSFCVEPVGYILAAPLAAGLGVGGALAFASVASILLALTPLLTRSVRHLDWPMTYEPM